MALIKASGGKLEELGWDGRAGVRSNFFPFIFLFFVFFLFFSIFFLNFLFISRNEDAHRPDEDAPSAAQTKANDRTLCHSVLTHRGRADFMYPNSRSLGHHTSFPPGGPPSSVEPHAVEKACQEAWAIDSCRVPRPLRYTTKKKEG